MASWSFINGFPSTAMTDKARAPIMGGNAMPAFFIKLPKAGKITPKNSGRIHKATTPIKTANTHFSLRLAFGKLSRDFTFFTCKPDKSKRHTARILTKSKTKMANPAGIAKDIYWLLEMATP